MSCEQEGRINFSTTSKYSHFGQFQVSVVQTTQQTLNKNCQTEGQSGNSNCWLDSTQLTADYFPNAVCFCCVADAIGAASAAAEVSQQCQCQPNHMLRCLQTSNTLTRKKRRNNCSGCARIVVMMVVLVMAVAKADTDCHWRDWRHRHRDTTKETACMHDNDDSALE